MTANATIGRRLSLDTVLTSPNGTSHTVTDGGAARLSINHQAKQDDFNTRRRSSTTLTGIDLIARNSINSMRRLSESASVNNLETNRVSDLNYQHDYSIDDRNWSLTFLRRRFESPGLEELCSRYVQRLQHGYFSVFIIINFVISVCHLSVLITETKGHNNKGNWKINTIIPDLIAYSIIGILPLFGFASNDKLSRKYPWLPLIISSSVVIILVISDIIIPIYHEKEHNILIPRTPLRPAYATHTILGCYMFLPLLKNSQAIILALSVTTCHILTLWMITFRHRPTEEFYPLIMCDMLYLICVNCLGLFFRFVNEIIIRRMFLDSRAQVESTAQLKFEKEREKQLTVSILPPHIEKRVTEDIKAQYLCLKSDHQTSRPSKLYVENHDNVTILYADIVNYTKMTSSLQVKTLVLILNELFGQFDDASEKHEVLRIKFLGDCYCSVAGVPQTSREHAKSCVNLGLDMIRIIRSVRDNHKLDIDMRIGVHTGKILSGLIGVYKWQYDIWSEDVDIANHMEQTGKPGNVHVTKQTLDLLNNEYHYEPVYDEHEDPLLTKNQIETFLISPSVSKNGDVTKYNRRLSNIPNRFGNKPRLSVSLQQRKENETLSVLTIPSRRGLFTDNSIEQFSEMMSNADHEMEDEIERLPLSKYEQWFQSQHINPLFLFFRDFKWELPYMAQPDPLFKFYILIANISLLCIIIIQGITLPRTHWKTTLTFGFVLLFFVILIPMTWMHYIFNNYKNPDTECQKLQTPKKKILLNLYLISQKIMMNSLIRTFLCIVIFTFLTMVAVIDMVQCEIEDTLRNAIIHSIIPSEPLNCVNPWNMTQCCSLAIIVLFLFLKVNFFLKLILGTLTTLLYSWIIWKYRPKIFENSESWNITLDAQIAHIMNIFFITFTMHLLDRQTEYMNRLDYQWKYKLNKEKEEAEDTHIINNALLQNILPIHIAEFYLNPKRKQRELYHEEYKSIAVMFASISGMNDSRDTEYSMLEVLNDIICEFDSILVTEREKGCSIEKIKLARWTYMAACGLHPGQKNIADKLENSKEHVLIMTRFASDIMNALHNIYPNLKLRIGISYGQVFAGVVGAKKPLYDIWGDTVNMASRMDSTGLPDRIQVTESTALILEQEGIQCEFRGPIFVKGKGMVTTYFVSQNEKNELIHHSDNVNTQL